MNDAELLRRLAVMFEKFDPVPPDIDATAMRAGQLAGHPSTALALVADGLPGTRGDGRLLGFAGNGGRIELEIDSDGLTVELTGVASTVGELWVRWPSGNRHVDVDTWGRFSVVGLPTGPLSLTVRADGAPDAVGPWFVG